MLVFLIVDSAIFPRLSDFSLKSGSLMHVADFELPIKAILRLLSLI